MSKSVPFRVQSHVLKLLGDELIGHDRLAIFELVKNSYDADATDVYVTLDLDSKTPAIIVEDNGIGMPISIIENSWLEIGTDSKRKIAGRKRTDLGRLPLGEKGVGRLAVQKLGKKLDIYTRATDNPENVFSIDWEELINSSRYLGDGLKVEVEEKTEPDIFKDGTGTRVKISHLYNMDWTRRDIRDLYRLVTSLCNPFESSGDFKVHLALPGREHEIKDLPSLEQMLESAVWNFTFELSKDGVLSWNYEFSPPRFKGLKSNKSSGSNKLQLLEADQDDSPVEKLGSKKKDDHIFLRQNDLVGIGPIKGKIYAFHRRDEILKASGASQQIKKWLDNQTGVRVYRDNIRVFNYGEPGEDWLGLDARRINRPTGKLGTQSVIAQISLDLDQSFSLKEKTNREGFDENEEFRRLRRIVLSIFDLFQRQHAPDRSAIDVALKGNIESPPTLQVAIQQLESIAKQNNLEKEVKPVIQSIQQEIDMLRDVMVTSGLAGMNLALVFHEVVHSIDRIQSKLKNENKPEDIKIEIDYLRKLLDTFKPLLQRDRVRKVTSEDLIDRALGMHEERFKRHDIVLSNWATDPKKSHIFSATLPRGLLVAALSNVIDNAIYWTRYRREKEDRIEPGALLIVPYWDENTGGMIAIIDNGPGFHISPDQIGKPFTSTRAGGMGLGLFYCKTVMEAVGGTLEIIRAEELRDIINIPNSYDGAAVIFSFKRDK